VPAPDHPRFRPSPALGVVVLAGAVHVARRNLVDVLVFLLVAVLMALAPTRDRAPRPLPRWLERPWPVAGAAVVLATVVALSPRTSAVVEAALGVVGVAALAVTLLAGRGAPAAPGRSLRTWPWAVVVLVGCLLELANFLTQPDPQTDNPAHPTLSALVDPLLDDGWVRAVAAGAWLLLGWWVVRTVAERDG